MAWKYESTTISAGADHTFVASAPVVLHSVIIANASDSAAAMIGLYNGSGVVGYMDFAVVPGGTVIWSGSVALPKGLQVYAEAGSARVTVMYV